LSFQPVNLYTTGVSSLHTSIPDIDDLKATEFFLDGHLIVDSSTSTLTHFTQLVLDLNIFEYDIRFFKQISGLAMCTKINPSYDCLFLGYLEFQI